MTAAAGQTPPHNGPRESDPGWHALVHATAIVAPGQTVADATVVIRDGAIVTVAAGVPAPEGAQVHDCTGLLLFAGMIDAHVPVPVPDPPAGNGRHWNVEVRAEVRATAAASLDDDVRRELRDLGFAAVALVPSTGIFRGTAAVVLLLDRDPDTGALPPQATVAADAYHSIDLAPGSTAQGPNSLMGCVALVRQTLLDAQTRAGTVAAGMRVSPSGTLDALAPGRALPLMFVAHGELDVLRAASLALEFGRPTMVVANGTEFRRLAAIAAAKVPLVVPLAYPVRPEVSRPGDQDRVSLRDLMTWEQAPTNLRRLDAAAVQVALTTDRLSAREQFPARLRAAVEAGLPPARALAMLTTVPAELLGVSDRLGSITAGKLANLVLVRGTDPGYPLAGDNVVVETWVSGRRWPTPANEAPLQGTWQWTATLPADRAIAGELRFGKRSVELRIGDKKVAARSYERRGARVTWLLAGEALAEPGILVLTGRLDDGRLSGSGLTAGGLTFPWSAQPAIVADEVLGTEPAPGTQAAPAPDELPLPFGAFGFVTRPVTRDCVVQHATLWTAGPAAIIEDGTLVVRGGKIEFAGPSRDAPPPPAGALLIDARGKHVTPGLIDCHSHTGIAGGVNESSQAVTAEVRIADVLDPDDVNFYRQLAGGVTCANLLHGSANPIGGQNAVVKLRWGCTRPEDMLLAGAPAGIKFALGENPKRSRAREPTTRYPRTRLGVEALIRDRLVAAREYAQRRATEAGRAATPRDLELDALAEVLAGSRLVHCHSYRQDEIVMLCKVAREFGFRIGTFQHALEGYKVAESIRTAALGASIFSDWWGYKIETWDAIPHNGALMRQAGVVVSFNSDSSELARRLNAEAGKAVKYGRVPPAEALKFVSLNAAVQLGLQDRIGSLEAGKDADFVLWSGEPLRTTSQCEMTFVDGVPLFDRARDLRLRAHVASERLRIVQKVLADRSEPGTGEAGTGEGVDRGSDDAAYACGECGCQEVGR